MCTRQGRAHVAVFALLDEYFESRPHLLAGGSAPSSRAPAADPVASGNPANGIASAAATAALRNPSLASSALQSRGASPAMADAVGRFGAKHSDGAYASVRSCVDSSKCSDESPAMLRSALRPPKRLRRLHRQRPSSRLGPASAFLRRQLRAGSAARARCTRTRATRPRISLSTRATRSWSSSTSTTRGGRARSARARAYSRRACCVGGGANTDRSQVLRPGSLSAAGSPSALYSLSPCTPPCAAIPSC